CILTFPVTSIFWIPTQSPEITLPIIPQAAYSLFFHTGYGSIFLQTVDTFSRVQRCFLESKLAPIAFRPTLAIRPAALFRGLPNARRTRPRPAACSHSAP